MPYCPVCRYEYMSLVSMCPDCDEYLVEHLPEENTEPNKQNSTSEKTVPVYIADNAMEAQIIKEMLESHDIQVWYNSRRDTFNQHTQAYSLFAQSAFDIFVEESKAEEAKRLIEQTDDSFEETSANDDDWLKPNL